MSETKVYHIEEIMQMLPHRYPFLLVDRLEVEVPGEKGVGTKNVTMNEEFFQGHFPGNPLGKMNFIKILKKPQQNTACIFAPFPILWMI